VNWIKSIRPKIRGLLTTKRDLPKLWVKCPETGQMVFHKDLEANQFVVPGSNYHMRMAAQTRLAHIFDDGEYQRVPVREVPQDPLKFRDSKPLQRPPEGHEGRNRPRRRRAGGRGQA